jgi:cobalt-zinc-cadmium efflux system protein
MQRELLARRFGIDHVTLQPELAPDQPLVFVPHHSRRSDDRR